MPYDRHLAEEMRAALADRRDVSERSMFGGRCWFINGNMLCGVEVGRYLFRVGKERRDEALKRPGAERAIMGGRDMGGFIWIDADVCLDGAMQDWIDFAMVFVGSLPPK